MELRPSRHTHLFHFKSLFAGPTVCASRCVNVHSGSHLECLNELPGSITRSGVFCIKRLSYSSFFKNELINLQLVVTYFEFVLSLEKKLFYFKLHIQGPTEI